MVGGTGATSRGLAALRLNGNDLAREMGRQAGEMTFNQIRVLFYLQNHGMCLCVHAPSLSTS